MKKYTIWSVLLFAGLIISEIPTVLRICSPETSVIKYNLFLDKAYNEQITVQWYIFELGHIINRIIWVYIVCKLALLVSKKLFLVSLTFMFYQVCNLFFYIWDRNSSAVNNLILYCVMAVVLIEILIPSKKAKVKSIES